LLKGFSRTWHYLSAYKKELFWGNVAVLLTNIFSIFVPELLKRAIDGISSGMAHENLVYFAGAIVFAALLQGVFRFFSRNILIGMSRKVEYDMRKGLFAHLQKLPVQYFWKSKTGDIMSRLTNDLEDVRMMLGPGMMYTINTVIILSLAGYMMVRISPSLALYSLFSFGLFILYIYSMSNKLLYQYKRVRQHTAEVTAFIQESFSGIQLFKIYRQEEAQNKRFIKASDEYLQSNMKLIKILGTFMPSINFISGLGSLLILYFGGIDVISGTISMGDFIAFGVYLALLTPPVIGLGWAASLFQRGRASLERFGEIFDEAPEEYAGRTIAFKGDEALRFENVSFEYPNSDFKVSNISFSVPKGSITAIVGGVGSGKSTLAKLLPRIIEPTSGSVYVGGVEHKEIALKELRRIIGFVPQENFLYSESIRQNIMMDIEIDEEELDEIIVFSQLKHEIYEFPDKFETMLGERGVNLSGGQQQRLALARAIAARPSVLVLDDAFSSIDVNTERKIIDRFRNFVQDITTLIISHRLTCVAEADHILVMSHGSIAEEGTHDSLMRAGGLYAKMFRLQQMEEALQ